jgi:CRISPR-associated exonuclease Cas4
MILYEEDEFLQLSGIQHFAFCRRQWALAYLEMQWQENVRTVEGKLLHEKAHDASIKEKRGDLLIVRALPVHSREIGISGECDVVEFHKSKDGVPLFGQKEKYRVVPVEYKRGRPKKDDIDALQIAAQALCLEEMLCCEIPYGYIYYGETRHREKISFDDALRKKVRDLFLEMHKYDAQQYTPKVKRSKKCNACSLKDVCLPVLNQEISVKDYICRRIGEKEGVE